MTLRENLLRASDDDRKEKKVFYTVRKDKKKLETAIILKEEEIDSLEQELLDKKAAENFNIDGIITVSDNLDLAKRDLKLLHYLLEEMFNDKTF